MTATALKLVPTASPHPLDGKPVLESAPLRRGHKRSALSRFEDSTWDLAPAVFRENARVCHITAHFGEIENASVARTLREFLYARLNFDVPGHRSRLPPGSIRQVFNRARRFLQFVAGQARHLPSAERRSGDPRCLSRPSDGRSATPARSGRPSSGSRRRSPSFPRAHAIRWSRSAAVEGPLGAPRRRLQADNEREQDAAFSGAGHRASARVVAQVRHGVFGRHPRRPCRTGSPAAAPEAADCRGSGAFPKPSVASVDVTGSSLTSTGSVPMAAACRSGRRRTTA